MEADSVKVAIVLLCVNPPHNMNDLRMEAEKNLDMPWWQIYMPNSGGGNYRSDLGEVLTLIRKKEQILTHFVLARHSASRCAACSVGMEVPLDKALPMVHKQLQEVGFSPRLIAAKVFDDIPSNPQRGVLSPSWFSKWDVVGTTEDDIQKFLTRGRQLRASREFVPFISA